jgi:hypothetical protein
MKIVTLKGALWSAGALLLFACLTSGTDGYCTVTTTEGSHYSLYQNSAELCKDCQQEFCVVHNTLDRKIAIHRRNTTLDVSCATHAVKSILKKKSDNSALETRMFNYLNDEILASIAENCTFSYTAVIIRYCLFTVRIKRFL